jgi:MFS family permease
MNLASMVGALFISGYIGSRWGRKWPSIITVIPYTIGWCLIAFPVNYTMLLVGQVICGFVTGLRAPIGRMYMAEVSHPRYRGEFLTSITTLVMASSLLSYVLALVLNWQQLAIFSGVLPLAMIPLMCYVPESYVWLISKKRHDEAREAWKWFNGDEYVEVSPVTTPTLSF